MSLVLPKSNTKEFESPSAGTYNAVLYRIIDLGTQTIDYKGEKKEQRKIRLFWELHGEERMEDGRPFSVSKQYTYSSHEKSALRRDLEAWRGKKFTEEEIGVFEIDKLLGIGCTLGITEDEASNGKTYTNVSSVAKLMSGMETPKPENEVYCLQLDARYFNDDLFQKQSDYYKEIIMKSPEYQDAVDVLTGIKTVDADGNVTSAKTANDDIAQSNDTYLDDEIPF